MPSYFIDGRFPKQKTHSETFAKSSSLAHFFAMRFSNA